MPRPPNHLRPAVTCIVVLTLSAPCAHWLLPQPSPRGLPDAAFADVLSFSKKRDVAAAPLVLAATPARGASVVFSKAPVVVDARLLDPAFLAGRAPMRLAASLPPMPGFTFASLPPAEISIDHLTVVAQIEPKPAALDPAAAAAAADSRARIVPSLTADLAVPIPIPRPASLSATRDARPREPGRRNLARRSETAALVTPPPDNRSFFDKLFGVPASNTAVTAYAPAAGSLGLGLGLRSTLGGIGTYGRQTAVYEIASHTVFLPDGTRLEAHSGLGESLDNPSSVHQRMRGSTPPNVYDLTLREQPFHGVRALRLNPTGGTTYGRDGLLAHTYMLGPNGASNGCVSFRDYNAFLQAYDSGAIRRLAVVARLN